MRESRSISCQATSIAHVCQLRRAWAVSCGRHVTRIALTVSSRVAESLEELGPLPDEESFECLSHVLWQAVVDT
jgi:hypothetical protein